MCLFFCNAATVWVKIEVWRLYLNLRSAVWSSSDRMIDRWGVIIGRTATIMPIKHCLLLLPVLFLSVYQMMTIMQKAGHHHAASAHLFFFFFFLVILSSWSAFVWGETCCCRWTSSGLLGPCGCPSLLRCWCTPPYLRLDQTVLNTCSSVCTFGVSLLWHWPGFPQNCEGVAGFLLKVTH